MSVADGELTSIALCWRLERSDGAGLVLTSHDVPLERDGAICQPTPGMMPAAIIRRLGLEAQSGEASGALSSDTLDPADLAQGRWDGARVQLTAVDWDDGDSDPILLLGGEIGAVSIDDDSFAAELHGAAAKLDRPICPTTSAECRAEFGDESCRIDLAGRTVSAQVVSSEEGALTLDRELDQWFVLGRLRFLGGANCGLATIILAVDGATVRIRDLPRAAVEPSCRVELREGCDKRFETCIDRFANSVNFCGEPHLPGNDLLTRYPGA